MADAKCLFVALVTYRPRTERANQRTNERTTTTHHHRLAACYAPHAIGSGDVATAPVSFSHRPSRVLSILMVNGEVGDGGSGGGGGGGGGRW